MNHIKCSTNTREGRKDFFKCNKEKTVIAVLIFTMFLSIITLNVNDLNIPVKDSQDLKKKKNNKTQDPTPTLKTQIKSKEMEKGKLC